MMFRLWLDGLKARVAKRCPKHKSQRLLRNTAGYKLALDALESRTLPAFLAPVGYGTDAYPYAVVTAYFNNDSVLDLAVANYSASTVNVLLGNSDGTFQEPALTFPTGSNPLSIAVGDFDGDTDLDLATANSYDVSVLLGNGTGSFGAASSYVVPYSPSSVAVGDFTGDGLLDLGVTSNYVYDDYYTYANVLVGNGAGDFSGPNTTWVGYGSLGSATAVNLDGAGPDELVVANSVYGYYYGAVTVLAVDGTGFFQPVNSLYTGMDATAVTVGNVNGDSHADLITANGYSGDSVSVLLGDGVGGFGAAQNYATGSYPSSVVLGDFTGDGDIDIATADYFSNTVSVLYGGGNGTFSNPVHYSTGTNPWALASGDFNGDSWLDTATTDTGANTVSVLLNDHIWPSPPPPAVSINDVTVTESSAGNVNANFTVRLSNFSNDDVWVHYNTADSSATGGSDYTTTSGDVLIPAGTLTQLVTVVVTDDLLGEPTETFAVNLSAPVNATLGDAQGIGTILDNEPRVSINDVSVTEGNTGSVNATFTVTLSALSTSAVSVQYNTANNSAVAGSDYTTASGTLTIPAGQSSRTFTVAVTGDRLAESNETYFVNLSAPVNAGIGDGQGIGTILDNEPRLSINSVSKKEGNGNTTKFLFTVTLSASFDQSVTVNYSTAPGSALAGSDYQTKTGTLTFAPGVRTMTITIIVVADKLKEANEAFSVNLSGPSSNAFISVAQGIGTILNDDNH